MCADRSSRCCTGLAAFISLPLAVSLAVSLFGCDDCASQGAIARAKHRHHL